MYISWLLNLCIYGIPECEKYRSFCLCELFSFCLFVLSYSDVLYYVILLLFHRSLFFFLMRDRRDGSELEGSREELGGVGGKQQLGYTIFKNYFWYCFVFKTRFLCMTEKKLFSLKEENILSFSSEFSRMSFCSLSSVSSEQRMSE